jgi:hypothetical protein
MPWAAFFALLWVGMVYGALDALLLTLMPVLALQQMYARLGMPRHRSGTVMRAVVALGASLFVTALYH